MKIIVTGFQKVWLMNTQLFHFVFTEHAGVSANMMKKKNPHKWVKILVSCHYVLKNYISHINKQHFLFPHCLVSPGRKHKSSLGPTTKVLSQPRRNIVGCRIQHVWKEGGGHVVWKGTVLDQVVDSWVIGNCNCRLMEGLMQHCSYFSHTYHF